MPSHGARPGKTFPRQTASSVHCVFTRGRRKWAKKDSFPKIHYGELFDEDLSCVGTVFNQEHSVHTKFNDPPILSRENK